MTDNTTHYGAAVKQDINGRRFLTLRAVVLQNYSPLLLHDRNAQSSTDYLDSLSDDAGFSHAKQHALVRCRRHQDGHPMWVRQVSTLVPSGGYPPCFADEVIPPEEVKTLRLTEFVQYPFRRVEYVRRPSDTFARIYVDRLLDKRMEHYRVLTVCFPLAEEDHPPQDIHALIATHIPLMRAGGDPPVPTPTVAFTKAMYALLCENTSLYMRHFRAFDTFGTQVRNECDALEKKKVIRDKATQMYFCVMDLVPLYYHIWTPQSCTTEKMAELIASVIDGFEKDDEDMEFSDPDDDNGYYYL